MQITQLLQVAGDHAFTAQGQAGRLEGQILVPEICHPQTIAVLGHPHSLQGGTMQNKVITTIARACRDIGIPSIRFNFRGVGQSEGLYDHGIGEADDMLSIARLWMQNKPDSRFIFAGFSFGSYVTARAASQWPHQLLLSVAPPVTRYDYTALYPAIHAWHILQGETDEVCDLADVVDFASQFVPPIPMHRFPATTHFFHGKLLELRSCIQHIIQDSGACL